MENASSNLDIVFDRLVDGELSSTERRSLLESLDSQPQGWRRCALAFLEAQSWRNDLRSVATDSAENKAEQKTVAPSAWSERTSILAAARWLAIAASLLIAFKLGNLQQGSVGQVAGGSADRQLAGAPSPTPPAAAPGDALNLWVRDDTGQLKRVRVPLIDANTLDHKLGLQFQSGMPENVRDELHDHGYAVQSKHKYAPMWLENGQPMIVPVEDTKIVPVSNKVY
jgi:hypothetical protein